ncbi:MAG: hydrogenase expression/formation C-terminal domain-containing protein [Candidatus Thiodiazotropha sp.]|jgi:hydrogenase-1 operon protein HyaF
MQKLQDIAVRVEATDGLPLNHSNATPIMHEVLHALQRLARDNESTTIDLRAIPFGPGDEEQLLNQLGVGEIQIEMNSLGRSLISETAFSGVWLVDHRNADDQRIALQIEITPVPSILLAQQEDVLDAIDRLDDWLNPSITESAGQ